MTTDYEAKMLRDLNGSLNDLLERMQCWEQWLISYCDMRTPMRPDAEVYLLVSHRSMRNGNAVLARIDAAEVEKLEILPPSEHVASGGVITVENGFRITMRDNDGGAIQQASEEDSQHAFEVLTARDVLSALCGMLVCYHADALESAQRSESASR